MDIDDRVIAEAHYILDSGSTVREAAKYFNLSKSTVHADVTRRLKNVDGQLYREIQKLMAYHFSVRHLRGGEATKIKYSHKVSHGDGIGGTPAE